MLLKKISFCLAIILTLFSSCKKDDKIDPHIDPAIMSGDGNGQIAFNFSALADNLPLIPDTKWYINANGDSFTVARFNYYISNIKLKRNNNIVFSEAESYHVIKHLEGSKTFIVANVPNGDYDAIEFMIGVDSARNVSGAQTGALSQSENMFWSWSSGYIFFKLEGEFRTPSTPPGSTYAMHVGGYSGKDNCLRTCTFDLINKISVQNNKGSKVFYDVNVKDIFSNPAIIALDTYYVIASGPQGKALADNYKNMFVVNRIEN